MKKKTLVITALAVLLIGGTVWALMGHTDPQMQKVQDLQNVLATEEGRRDPENWKQLHEEMQKLTPEQQDQIREQRHDKFEELRENRENQMAAEYFALPPDQQTAFLDKQIQEEENWMKQMQSRRNQRGQGPNGMGPGPGSMGQGQGGPGAGPRGRSRFQTAEQRSMRMNKRLDRSTPTQRAQQTAYRQAMVLRRAQLGLPTMGGPGGGRR
jgi:hypothetical protein